MGFTTAEKNSAAAKLAADLPYAAVFTADPGSTGTATGEVTGGSYARTAISWGSASGGVIVGTATLVIPTGPTITHGAACSSVSGSTVGVSQALGASQGFPTGGSYVLTITLTAA